MCLPDIDYQTFEIIKGRKVFVPNIIRALPGLSEEAIWRGRDIAYANDAARHERVKRLRAAFTSHGDFYPALKRHARYIPYIPWNREAA